jgi:hypothetical protein
MSDQRMNMCGELVEEDRSVEESSMGESTRDFFAEEDEAPLLESQGGPETLAKGPGVSIFNTSGPIGSSREEEKYKEGSSHEFRSAKQSEFKSSSEEGKGMGKTMNVDDLNPSVGKESGLSVGPSSTLTESQYHQQAPLGGERTKMERLAEQSNLGAARTKRLANATGVAIPTPPKSEEGTGRKALAKPDSHSIYHLNQPARLKDKGGVRMQWFLEEDEEEDEELAEAQDDERERARKKELPGRVFDEMVVVTQHLEEVKLLVTELKMEEDPEVELVKFDLLGDYHRNGITRLCLIDCGEIEPMELQQADLVTMSEAMRESDWAALKLSKKRSCHC